MKSCSFCHGIPPQAYSGACFDQRSACCDSRWRDIRDYPWPPARVDCSSKSPRECREAYGADVRLSFLCGRDAAERIANWDYGRPGAFLEMLRQFDILVAARAGEYCPPGAWPVRSKAWN